MAFAPRLTPDNFGVPFIAAEGWGTYSQIIAEKKMRAEIETKWGRVKLQTINLTMDAVMGTVAANPDTAGKNIPMTCSIENTLVKLAFANGITISESQKLSIEID